MKKFISIFLIIIVCISIFSPLSIYATEYTYDSGEDGIAFYTSDNTEIEDLFDFTLGDIPKVIPWVFRFKTFVVFRISEQEDGTRVLKGYFNTPNLQMLAKNLITHDIADGYTDETYNINDDKDGLVKVGDDADKVNAITRYGFAIPNYTYFGEYPQEYMSIKNIIPVGFFEGLWRAIKALFGLSFIEAPDASNYKTLSYYNHEYTDRSEQLIKFIQKYWSPYFKDSLDKSKFYDAHDFREAYITEDTYLKSKSTYEASSYTLTKEVFDALFSGYNEIPYYGTHYIDWDLEETHRGFRATGDSADELINNLLSRYDILANQRYPKVEDAYTYCSKFKSQMNILLSSLSMSFYDENGSVDSTVKSWYKGSDRTEEGLEAGAPWIPNGTVEIARSVITNAEYYNFIENKEKYLEIKEKWENFQKLFNSGGKSGGEIIYYNQCLIENEGNDKECWSRQYSDEKTSIAIGNVYAFSGIDKIRSQTPSGRLTRKQAIEIIQKIQNYCGPYYKEVMANIVICMLDSAKAKTGEILSDENEIDVRNMPYDIDSMVPTDRENFIYNDPRVEIFKSTILGSLISDISLSGGLGLYFKLQPKIINLAGKITKLSVFFQQLINFDLLDSYGLSPASMWTNAFVFLVMAALALLFIVKTTGVLIKYLTSGSESMLKVISMFLVLFLELGIFAAVSANPEKVWKPIKGALTTVINLGETVTVAADPELEYLFGTGEDRDYAVTYYIPYIDTWSLYNTGHGLLAEEQLIQNAEGKPELEKFKNEKYQISGKNINHWSVLLMDAFEFNGSSDSLLSLRKGDKLINGKIINNNAYRVVDHFLAPRINDSFNDVDGTYKNANVTVDVKPNENNNGNFQSGFLDLITKLLNVILICILSLLKLLTFLWLWFQLYVFFFKTLLSRTAERKNWPQILMETFSPLLGMIGIGLYVGICIKLNSYLTGVVGLLVQLGLYALTVVLIRWWSTTKVFPLTLKPIAILLNLKQYKRKKDMDDHNKQARTTASLRGFEITEEEIKDPDKYRDKLFDENGQMRTDFLNREGSNVIYEDWVASIAHKIRTQGYQPTQADIQALTTFNARLADGRAKYNYDTFMTDQQELEQRSKKTIKKTKDKKIRKEHQKETDDRPTRVED